MMIGTPTASSLWPAYLLTVFSVVAGFAVYDILYRRLLPWQRVELGLEEATLNSVGYLG